MKFDYTASISDQGSADSGGWTQAAPTSRKRPVKDAGASKGKFGDQLVNSLRSREAGLETEEVYNFGARQGGEFQFPLELPELEVLQDPNLRKVVLQICSRWKVNIYRNTSTKELIIEAANPEDIPPSVEAIRRALDDTRKELRRSKKLCLLHPPPSTTMKTQVTSKATVVGGVNLYSPSLTGPRLRAVSQSTWGEYRKLEIQYADRLEPYIYEGLPKDSSVEDGLTMNVRLGRLYLKTVDKRSLVEGFSDDAFTAMLCQRCPTFWLHRANAVRRLGGMEFVKSLLGRLDRDRRFEPGDGSVGTTVASPTQTLIYRTSRGSSDYRYETVLTLSARGRHNTGGGDLLDTQNFDERLSVRVLNFDSLDWTFEATTKKPVAVIPTSILDRIDKLLPILEPRGDSLGFNVPWLKARGSISDRETLCIKTSFYHRLIRLPYYIEVCLFHDLSSNRQPFCTVNLLSSDWDEIATKLRGNVDVSLLFPEKSVEGNGVRFFMELMEKLCQFVSDAMPVLE